MIYNSKMGVGFREVTDLVTLPYLREHIHFILQALTQESGG